MRLLLRVLFINIFFISIAFGQEVKIKVNPVNPVYKETFQIDFIISTKEEVDPVITFDPFGLEVISRNEGAVSTQATYINGKVTVDRKVRITYEMIAPRYGDWFLRDIKVNLNGKIVKHPTVRVQVLKKARKPKNIFVRAEVDQQEVFPGQSIIVRYYLYNKSNVNLTSTDIKRFPKLSKFLKRFHQEKFNPQTVSLDNQLYKRRIMYTAQLFAESPGVYKIDPITLRVGYREGGNIGNFGFGFNVGRGRSSTIRSKPLEIEVVGLPAEGMPENFSGLVGKHDFSLKVNKNKFIANEPIELNLDVSGNGALELFEAPALLDHDQLEEFESNSDLQVNKNFTAKKKFNYTYLGRGDVDLKDQKISLSYFDPEQRKYINRELKIGDIKVAGIGQNIKQGGSEKKPIDNNDSETSPIRDLNPPKVLSFEPLYKGMGSFVYNAKELVLVIGIVLICLIFYILLKMLKGKKPKTLTIFDQIIHQGLTYSLLRKALNLYEVEGQMADIIEKSSLPDKSKVYFIELVKEVNTAYDKDGVEKKFDVVKKHFQALQKDIEAKRDESLL